MKSRNRKTTATLIAIILIVSTGASSILIPTATAHTPAWQIPTYAYITVQPSPIGVGQSLTVFIWLDCVYDGAAVPNPYRFHNYALTITAPDGTTTSQTFATIQDTTSDQATSFTPTKIGTYIFNFTFPGQQINAYPHANDAYVNDTYLPSSASTTLTVQQEPIPNAIPSYPLPSAYWTRPIYGENAFWWSISSNWLGLGSPGYMAMGSWTGQSENPSDDVGPQTAHVMWTKPLQSGGVVGGSGYHTQGVGYFEGSAYNQRFTNPLIVNGKIYYTEPLSYISAASLGGGTYGPTDCVDLQTGQVIWSRTDVPALSFAYIYDVEDENQHGVYPAILCTSNFGRCFDADTGNPLFNVTGVPSGTLAMGPQGEQLRYVLANAGNTTNPDWRLGEWNSTKLFTGNGFSGNTTGSWSPAISGTVDGSISSDTNVNDRYDWNISIPWRNTMTATPTVLAASYNDIMLCRNGSLPGGFATSAPAAPSQAPYTYFAVNLKASKGAIGLILWMQTYNPPAGNITVADNAVDFLSRVFLEQHKETVQWVGYSLDTGTKLWGPTASQAPFDYYGNPEGSIAYGKLYTSSFSGICYCYDLKTGNLLWTFGNGGTGNSTLAGLNTAYGDYPTFVNAIGNGVVYLVMTEHTITDPIPKGELALAINATDGTEIWALSDYTGEFVTTSYAIADGYATFFNGYNNQVYSVGRGPSQLTVTAPQASIELGRSLVISGTVVDVSAGTKQTQQAGDFPNGVPVASDASMTAWMGYVYQQKPMPSIFTGVSVTISVIDSNGNYRTIGTTTTDSSGSFSDQWMPDISGKYTVIASFAGTKGYWPSSSEASFAVDPAAPSASPYPVVNLPPTETYVIGVGVVIIIAIAIVGILLAMMLRKRP
jgi:hypothetical protein